MYANIFICVWALRSTYMHVIGEGPLKNTETTRAFITLRACETLLNNMHSILFPYINMNTICFGLFPCQSRQLTIDTPDPHLTRCFQDTVITWLSYGWLVLALPVYWIYLKKKPTRSHNGSSSVICNLKLVSELSC